jgi:intein/homing endonuclease
VGQPVPLRPVHKDDRRVQGGIKLKIELEKLPEEMIVKLDDKFRAILFKEIKEHFSFSELADKLGVSLPYIYHLKNGRHGFRIKTLKNLCRVSNKKLSEIEDHVTELVSNRGARANVKLPINLSCEIAYIVGHCFGDGSISSKKKQFSYINKNKKLVQNVKTIVSKVFGTTPISEIQSRDGCFKVTFSSIVGKILVAAGAPIGEKVDSRLDAPQWIVNGDLESKRAFLRALFDDDGSVMISKLYRAKSVNIHFTRKRKYQKHFIRYLQTLRMLLREFKIETCNPYLARCYRAAGEPRCVMGILITDYGSILNFAKEIGFRQTLRKKALETLIKRGTAYAKMDILNDVGLIKRALNANPLSTNNIAKKVGLKRTTTLKRLLKMEKRNEVVRVGRIAPNRSLIWDLKREVGKSAQAV